MFNHSNKKPESFAVHVVRRIEVESINQLKPAALLEVIVATYRTGIKEFVYVPLNQAMRDVAGHEELYIATDNPEIAEKHKIKLIKQQ